MSKKIAEKIKRDLVKVGLEYLASSNEFYDLVDKAILSEIYYEKPLKLWFGEKVTASVHVGIEHVSFDVDIDMAYDKGFPPTSLEQYKEALEYLSSMKKFRELLDAKMSELEEITKNC